MYHHSSPRNPSSSGRYRSWGTHLCVQGGGSGGEGERKEEVALRVLAAPLQSHRLESLAECR